MLIFITSLNAQCPEKFHDFSATDIRGNNLDLSTFAGKKVLVVNTASYCGYTNQYAQLQQLYQTYGGPANSYYFEIIGFPANNFMDQEPYNEDSIQNVCDSYGVTFTMMSKVSVKGVDQHEIYKWLTLSSRNCVQNATVTWNFQKFLINPDGSWHATVAPATSPTHSSIVNWITANTAVNEQTETPFHFFVNEQNNLIISQKSYHIENYKVTIFNMIGQEISNYPVKNDITTINLDYLQKGIYIVNFSNEINSFSEKIILK